MKEKLKLRKLTLAFGANGDLTDDNISDFFNSVAAIDTLVVRGSGAKIADDMKRINDKLKDAGVFVGQINAEVIV